MLTSGDAEGSKTDGGTGGRPKAEIIAVADIGVPVEAAKPVSETFGRAVALARDSSGPAARFAQAAKAAGYDDRRAAAVYMAAVAYGAVNALRAVADTIGLDTGPVLRRG